MHGQLQIQEQDAEMTGFLTHMRRSLPTSYVAQAEADSAAVISRYTIYGVLHAAEPFASAGCTAPT